MLLIRLMFEPSFNIFTLMYMFWCLLTLISPITAAQRNTDDTHKKNLFGLKISHRDVLKHKQNIFLE